MITQFAPNVAAAMLNQILHEHTTGAEMHQHAQCYASAPHCFATAIRVSRSIRLADKQIDEICNKAKANVSVRSANVHLLTRLSSNMTLKKSV
jgi:hypothetical protein